MAEDKLSNLPAEVLYRIFHYCDAQTIICRIRRTCKRLRNIVKHYNQIELNSYGPYISRFTRSIPVQNVSSLTLSWTTRHTSENEIRSFIDYINQFSQLRSLLISHLKDDDLFLIFKHLNYTQLISLTIDSEDEPRYASYSEFASWMERSNLRKLYWPQLKYEINGIPWLNQCQLTHFIMNSCPYNQFYVILQHLPYLKTFGLSYFTDINDTVSVTSFTSSLTYLIIKSCTLPTQQLELLLSTVPQLRHLAIGFPELFDKCFIDVYDCENFIRTELNYLDRLEFFYYYELSQDRMPSFDSILAPFRTPFWLNEKHWFVDCECIFRRQYGTCENKIWTFFNVFFILVGGSRNFIVIFTESNTLDICDPDEDTDGILLKQNDCYLVKRERNIPTNPSGRSRLLCTLTLKTKMAPAGTARVTIIPCDVSII